MSSGIQTILMIWFFRFISRRAAVVFNDILKIDKRGYEDILREIAELAKKYTPEWRFSPDDPDAGTALACVLRGVCRRP